MRRPDTWNLSPREREVLFLVCCGRTNDGIARALRLSSRTVQTHVANLMRKTGAQTRTEMAVVAVRAGVVRMAMPRFADGGEQPSAR